MNDPIVPPPGGADPGILGGLGMFAAWGALMGGAGRRKREPETKREKAWKVERSLSDLTRALESMTTSAECILGTEAQGTASPFNAETNAMVGEIALLRRRAMIVKARLHALSLPKLREEVQKIAKEVDAAEEVVAKILGMPDLSPEQEQAIKEARQGKQRVVQALSLPGGPFSVQKIAEVAGVPEARVDAVLAAFVADGTVIREGDSFRRSGMYATSEVEPDDEDDE